MVVHPGIAQSDDTGDEGDVIHTAAIQELQVVAAPPQCSSAVLSRQRCEVAHFAGEEVTPEPAHGAHGGDHPTSAAKQSRHFRQQWLKDSTDAKGNKGRHNHGHLCSTLRHADAEHVADAIDRVDEGPRAGEDFRHGLLHAAQRAPGGREDGRGEGHLEHGRQVLGDEVRDARHAHVRLAQRDLQIRPEDALRRHALQKHQKKRGEIALHEEFIDIGVRDDRGQDDHHHKAQDLVDDDCGVGSHGQQHGTVHEDEHGFEERRDRAVEAVVSHGRQPCTCLHGAVRLHGREAACGQVHGPLNGIQNGVGRVRILGKVHSEVLCEALLR
mmetsp:Transcript_90790/g.259735  ORF Transcript_90790/g.259735 Transcript_90790/m.259735 type:complete len:327 (-) Transcript_90790:1811-2791(-)